MTAVKFKKGDKVRRKSGISGPHGDLFEVVGDGEFSSTVRVRRILPDEQSPSGAGGWYRSRFELVEAADTNSILDTAKELIAGSRAEAYGSFSHNAQQQADLWNAYLRTEDGSPRVIEAMDVPAMMALVKLMRLSGNNTHQDSWVDVAGFAGLAEQVHDGTVPPKVVRPAGVPPEAFRMRRTKSCWHYPNKTGWAWPSGSGDCLTVLFDDGTQRDDLTNMCYEGSYWERA